MRMLSNTEAELKKSVAYKKACSQAYMYDKHYMSCLKIKSICLEKNNANV